MRGNSTTCDCADSHLTTADDDRTDGATAVESPASESSEAAPAPSRHFQTIYLNLDNFDRDEEIPQDCPYVLTSPRSLQACRELNVRVSKFLSVSMDQLAQLL